MKDAKGHGSNGNGGALKIPYARARQFLSVADRAKFYGASDQAAASTLSSGGPKSNSVPVHAGMTDAAGIKSGIYNMLKSMNPSRPNTEE
jgi:hypothetical protein